MRACFILLLCLLCIAGRGQLLIRNTTLVDVENKKLLPAQDVLVENGRISATGKKLKAPAGIQTIDGSGKWLMPGLVDAHIHFFQSGGLYTRPDAIDLRRQQPYEKEMQWTHNQMEGLLRRYTRAGITTVIDVGSTVNFLKQRDSFRNKSYAPQIFMTGPLLTTYEPAAFKNLKDDGPFHLMTSTEEARKGVRRQLPFKPDFIKIWYIVTGRNIDSSARASLPLVQAVIDEAHQNGLRVAVHATESITARLSVEAGADFLVHGVEDLPVDDAFAQLLKTKGTVLSPTLVVAGNYGKVLGQTYRITDDDYRYAHPTPLATLHNMAGLPDTNFARNYKAYLASVAMQSKAEDSLRMHNLKRLQQGGVSIATGTDAGNIGTQHVSSYFDELRAMEQSGLNVWELLQASTINGAKAMGRQNDFGAVRKGMRADLLLLNKNPTEAVRNWQQIDWVINNGVALKPDSLVQLSPTELADAQLAAYNAHNLEAFLAPYADSIEIYDLESGKLQVKGKAAMRQQYNFLTRVDVLHCNLLNRIVQGNIVIDHEEIVLGGGRKVYGVAIYETRNGKIVKVWFPR